MPRRQFVADLQKVQTDALLPPGIVAVEQGEDDGQFEFEFMGANSGLLEPVKITAMIPDVSEYPKSHEYMIFCGDDAPRNIGAALQDVRGTNRKTVYELLGIVSATLTRLSPDKDGDTQMEDSQAFDDDAEDDDDDEDIYDSDHEAFEINAEQHTTPYAQPTPGKLKASDRTFRSRIRADLRAAKAAGFKVGHLGHLLDGYNAFVTVSIRMSKLGISEEAMQAWQVDPKDYLILIVQYPNGYKTNEELQSIDSLRLAGSLGMRICASKKYKPTLQEAIKAFTIVKKNDRDGLSNDLPAAEDNVDEHSLRETFISKPLNGFLQERLVPILRYRSAGMDWRGAEDWYSEIATKGNSGAPNAIPDKYYDPEPIQHTLPEIARADHHTARGVTQYSFPLLAIQFTLRHFVQCTDFCLVCHRKLDTELEAIKPYVCDQSLCLYQYMTLGFGPSIEHEIMAQPYVVDLLASFCYNSAASRRLKEFPDGLALMVPAIDPVQYNVVDPYAGAYYARRGQAVKEEPKAPPAEVPSYEVGFDRDRLEMIFFDKPEQCPVRRGSWMVLKTQGTLEGSELHCRVSEVTYYPTITIDEPILLQGPMLAAQDQANAIGTISAAPRTGVTPATTPKWAPATFQVYGQDFEQLDRNGKCLAICKLLDTLPNVKIMQEYLAKKRPADLKFWVERISPAALSLLRWIIASNRACIMQVDGDSGATHPQERLYGMKDYMQFRFAMGAPDKEQRFITEVRNTKQRLNLNYPTIFAWHGSPLHNWHMIIREGLHFKNADHGRAYGDGVYHAKDAHTSTGYSGMNYYGGGVGGAQGARQGVWPNSVLRINSALALNELVNAPGEFTSQNPYYVVQHLDWIQTRYLFVQCAPENNLVVIGEDKRPTTAHPQDPQRTPRGISNAVVIPASAIKSGRPAAKDDDRTPTKDQSPLKKMKGLGGFNNPIAVDQDDADDDSASVATDAEDLDILFDDDPEPVDTPLNGKGKILPLMEKPKPKGAATNFVAGTLDFSTLPLMPEPAYANTAATKRLMKELGSLAKAQEAAPLGDLGWYIDVEKIDNPYQWIVELHSFHVIDPTLKLVADMKKQDVKSIVLEIRFNKDFPFTPPYVRVIRPRFLSLMQGGGGHIVLGGAMCMELLTNTGWSSVSSMESVLMQIRLAIVSDPPARLDTRQAGDYGTAEAADGYMRACQTHGWAVPPGFKEMAYGRSDGGSGRY